jgi:hypothetical protein
MFRPTVFSNLSPSPLPYGWDVKGDTPGESAPVAPSRQPARVTEVASEGTN